MAITQGDVDKEKNKMLASKAARDAEWNGSGTSSAGYNVTAWLSELLKCNMTNAVVNRDAEGNITGSSCGTKTDCSNSTWQDRCNKMNIAIATYNLKQGTYLVDKAAYDKILADFIAQAPGVASSSEAKKDNAKTAAIVIIIILVVGTALIFLNKKYKFIPALA